MVQSIALDLPQNALADDDTKLVLAAQRNPAEFRQLYQKWLKPVYRYFYFRVGSVKDAEDLTSQVFLKVYENLPRYHDRGTFSSWLFSIAHARAVDFYRKGGREVPIEQAEESAEIAGDLLGQVAHSAQIEQVMCLIRGLPEDDQELIRLRFMAELSYREIGLVQGRSEEAVRKAITRLLNRIQTQLGDE